ncbi:MAG TPA: sulfotransferase [Tepidisphaeraceae bacterium]|nr:sulfotransferase [Tepidisphaeraceae bacterium]
MIDAATSSTAVPTARQPVIILGAHRSGTSMLAELLDQLGLFQGCDLQGDHESSHIVAINETLLRRVNASWDNPLPMRDFLACEPALRMTVLALRADLMSRRIRQFLGNARSLQTFDRPWGWKDPRTIFTLPLWLRLFPGARLVHIIRNGVDVAASLRARERKLLEQRMSKFDARMTRFSLRPGLDRAGYKGSARCLSLERGFELWGEYLRQADQVLRGIDNAIFTIRYEDFVAEPRRHLHKLAEFCGLHGVSEAAVRQAVLAVNTSRATAFAADPALSAFYSSVKDDPWMRQFVYDTPPP